MESDEGKRNGRDVIGRIAFPLMLAVCGPSALGEMPGGYMKKENSQRLFAEIMAEVEEKCYGCPFCYGTECLDLSCQVNDEAMTAIMSLDKKENY
jgi:hypothetical protein